MSKRFQSALFHSKNMQKLLQLQSQKRGNTVSLGESRVFCVYARYWVPCPVRAAVVNEQLRASCKDAVVH